MTGKAFRTVSKWAAVGWQAEEHTTREVVHAVDALVMPIKREGRGWLRQRPHLHEIITIKHQFKLMTTEQCAGVSLS